MLGVLAVVWGVVIGYSAGGSHRYVKSSLRFQGLIVVLFIVQGFFRGRLPLAHATRFAMCVWLTLSVTLVVLIWANRHLPGMALAATGILLNVDVVVANLAMPVGSGSFDSAGKPMFKAIAESGGFYQVLGPGTVAPFLADVMQLRLAGTTLMLSVGDLVLICAVVVFVVAAMRAPSPS